MNDQKMPDSLPLDLAPFEPGWVWLVGAGPGDPGLLTLYAVHALKSADVIVYDALVDQRILDLAPTGARLENAGKRGGKPSPTQPDISNRLVELAKENLKVLRLKGGDPFVFGRGGEEALTLVKEEVPFRVVPGITAGIGGLAYSGIPATHRDTNHVVSFITGHMAGGDLPTAIDWAALAKSSPVIVCYMALTNMKEICSRLMAGGRGGDELVAVISKASTPQQRVIETTLATCFEDTRKNLLEPPVLMVVGPVVRLRDGLDWLGALSGKILKTDPL